MVGRADRHLAALGQHRRIEAAGAALVDILAEGREDIRGPVVFVKWILTGAIDGCNIGLGQIGVSRIQRPVLLAFLRAWDPARANKQ